MSDAEPVDFSAIVCPETGVTAGAAATRALVAHLDLDGEVVAGREDRAGDVRAALVEDARVLTGLFAAELRVGPGDPPDRSELARTAEAAHRATMRSESFAFHTALAMLRLRDGPARH